MDQYTSFSAKTLMLIRSRYKSGSEQHIRLTELIQLSRYREKYGQAAYKKLLADRALGTNTQDDAPLQMELGLE